MDADTFMFWTLMIPVGIAAWIGLFIIIVTAVRYLRDELR